MRDEIKRGEVYYANLAPVIGSEQHGENRPVIVIQNNRGNTHSPTIIVAPITSKGWRKQKLPTHVRLNGTGILADTSIALLEQIKTIDRSRIGSYIGTLNEESMCHLNKALAVSVGLKGR